MGDVLDRILVTFIQSGNRHVPNFKTRIKIECMAVVTKDSHVGRKINKIKKSEFHERMHLFFSFRKMHVYAKVSISLFVFCVQRLALMPIECFQL